MGSGGASFYLEASEDLRQSEKPFALDYEDVVRVEGDADELWQNVHYNWDGTSKEPSSR